MKHIFFILALIAFTSQICAESIEVANADGVTISYNFINNKTELQVTYTGSYPSGNGQGRIVYSTYSGVINIPSSVTYEDKNYKVTEIGSQAFKKCTNLTNVSIPNSIINIGISAFQDCSGLTSIMIPNSVTSIGDGAFSGCNNLKSIIIPNSVTSIGFSAFSRCSNLTSLKLYCKEVGSWFDGLESISELIVGEEVEYIEGGQFDTSIWYHNQQNGLIYIGNILYKYKGSLSTTSKVIIKDNTTSISSNAFISNKELTSITFPASLKRIGNNSFAGCTNLTSITLPEQMEKIGDNAFSGCDNLTLVTLNSNLLVSKDRSNGYQSSRESAFSKCFGSQVTSYILGNTITRIGENAFLGCDKMTSIIMSKNIKEIGRMAFSNCTALQKVIVPDIASWCDVNYNYYSGQGNQSNPLFYAQHLFSDENTEISELKIPEGVTNIGNIAFINCKNITSVTFPSTLKTIGNMAFIYCDGLTSIDIPEGVTEINASFWGCTNLTNVKLPTSLTKISSSAFNDCKLLSSINIPSNVTAIESNAFAGCESLKELSFPDNIISVGGNAFNDSLKLYVNRKSATLLAMWQAGYKPYLMGTEDILEPPYLSVVATSQTTATFKIENIYDEFNYSYGYTWNAIPIIGDEVTITNLFPETSTYFQVGVSLDESGDYLCNLLCDYSTQPIAPTIDIKVTASSIHATATYTEGDAEVTSQRLVLNPSSIGSKKIYGGTDVEGISYTITGLDPNTSNTSFAYEIIVSNENDTRAYHTQKIIATTEPLKLTTQQPKVVSVGNVIVAAESNLDDEETNVGFEWRRTDWTDDFVSNKGNAYLYEGVMEGYIRNLYAEKLWKYRPYYTSDSGNTYYGEWVGLDPTNTSYFEPTVHTYAKVDVSEGTATLNGYVMTGTDAITEQGFEYWTTDESSNAQHRAPQNVQTIKATGQRMTAKLTGLKNNTTYYYRAYVKTVNNTTYGEERSFKTPIITGIKQLSMSENQPKTFNIYTLSGSLVRHQATTLEGLSRGIYIVNRKKIMVK